MMRRVIDAAKTVIHKNFQSHIEAVNCHHNYVQKERHFGEDVYPLACAAFGWQRLLPELRSKGCS
jgi:RNA-splicing ligase RtcB